MMIDSFKRGSCVINPNFSSVREKSEIEAFVKDAVAAGEHCLGRCLYISGVPGTGKVSGPNFFSLYLICMFFMC